MHDQIPPEDFESAPVYKLPNAHRSELADQRRVFRQMLKDELAEHPLTAAKRREYMAFAKRVGLDKFEASLYIRAVEYECGHLPPPVTEEAETSIDLRYAETPDVSSQPWITAGILVALMVMFLIMDLILKR